MNLARGAYVRGIAPLGANRAAAHLRAGLPDSFRPALDYLFWGKLEPDDGRAVERVEALRRSFASSPETFPLFNVFQTAIERSAREIAEAASVTPQWGAFLYLCAKGFRAGTILELGSCAGISTCFLASDPFCRRLISVEWSPELARVAEKHVQQILPGAQVLNAPIDEILPQTLALFENDLQLYYVDAFHQYASTLRFMQTAIPHLARGALVVFDDIHWSKPMWQAWQELRAHEGFSHTLDVGRFGLCVWQGGAVRPKQYNLAKYAGWLWDFAPRPHPDVQQTSGGVIVQ